MQGNLTFVFYDGSVKEWVNLAPLRNEYSNYEECFKDKIKAFPGMAELIKGLKEKGYKTGIVTSRLRESTLIGLESMGLLAYIDEIVTVEETDIHKHHPEPALICLDKLNRMAGESLMIGDSDFDIGCGNNAGMTTVLVGWSATAKSEAQSVARNAVPSAHENQRTD